MDLFCGAGGMSLGFEQAGFEVVVAVDADCIHTATHLVNFPNCATLTGNIVKVAASDIRSAGKLRNRTIDVVFGGPPCQGFSAGGLHEAEDQRNLMVLEFARLVRELRPRYFVMENVDRLLSHHHREMLRSFLRRVRRAGYSVDDDIEVLDAYDFGVPQHRRRAFIVGARRGLPAPTYPNPAWFRSWGKPTVWDAIGDLPEVTRFDELLHSDVYVGELTEPSRYAELLRGHRRGRSDRARRRPIKRGLTGCLRTIHSQEILRRFAATPVGKREPISRFFRLDARGVAWTLRAGTTHNRGRHTAPRPIHPVTPRCITVREAARLQSFPDWFEFHGTKWHGFRQVGNSVPPLLARAVARRVIALLE